MAYESGIAITDAGNLATIQAGVLEEMLNSWLLSTPMVRVGKSVPLLVN